MKSLPIVVRIKQIIILDYRFRSLAKKTLSLVSCQRKKFSRPFKKSSTINRSTTSRATTFRSTIRICKSWFRKSSTMRCRRRMSATSVRWSRTVSLTREKERKYFPLRNHYFVFKKKTDKTHLKFDTLLRTQLSLYLNSWFCDTENPSKLCEKLQLRPIIFSIAQFTCYIQEHKLVIFC